MVKYLDANSFTTLKTRLSIALPNGAPITEANASEIKDIYKEVLGRKIFRPVHDSMIKLGLLSPILVFLKKPRPRKSSDFPESYIHECYNWFDVDYDGLLQETISDAETVAGTDDEEESSLLAAIIAWAKDNVSAESGSDIDFGHDGDQHDSDYQDSSAQRKRSTRDPRTLKSVVGSVITEKEAGVGASATSSPSIRTRSKGKTSARRSDSVKRAELDDLSAKVDNVVMMVERLLQRETVGVTDEVSVAAVLPPQTS